MSTMKQQQIFACKGIEVSFDPIANVIRINWRGFAASNNYRKAMVLALEKVNKSKNTSWVSDLRNMEVVCEEDIKWTNEVFYPKWEKAKINNVAVIEPQKVFGRVSFKKMLSREIIRSMDMKFFLDEKSAFNYVEKNRK